MFFRLSFRRRYASTLMSHALTHLKGALWQLSPLCFELILSGSHQQNENKSVHFGE